MRVYRVFLVIIFLNLNIYGCFRSRRSRAERIYKKIKKAEEKPYRNHTKLVCSLSKRHTNILEIPASCDKSITNVLLYVGLTSQDDFVQFCVRNHYKENIDSYWKSDVGKIGLQAILLADNLLLFDVLMENSAIRSELITTAKYICSNYKDKAPRIFAKYGENF